MSWREALTSHYPEYLIEGWALGTFMLSAGLFSVLLDWPGSPVQQVIADPTLRRVLAGIAMGLTAISIIYSRWGKRSGAHMNPAITLAFLRLGKIRGKDAVFYIAAQFIGGTVGVLAIAALFGAAFSDPPVRYAATLPGPAGVPAAFIAEVVISAGMMTMILLAAGSARFAPRTGLFAGTLVALYISIEGPFSGMSMNPARTFASAAPGMSWEHFWLYVAAPLLGMLGVAQLYVFTLGRKRAPCAKLVHPPDVRCIHCGHEPVRAAKRAVGAGPIGSVSS